MFHSIYHQCHYNKCYSFFQQGKMKSSLYLFFIPDTSYQLFRTQSINKPNVFITASNTFRNSITYCSNAKGIVKIVHVLLINGCSHAKNGMLTVNTDANSPLKWYQIAFISFVLLCNCIN